MQMRAAHVPKVADDRHPVLTGPTAGMTLVGAVAIIPIAPLRVLPVRRRS